MSNLPRILPSIKAYESSPLQIRLDMYEGFVDPGVTFEIYFNGVKKYEVPGVYDSGLNRVTADFTAEQIQAMPLIADCRIRYGDDSYPFRVEIKPSSSGSSDGVIGYSIQQAGDSYTVVQIYAKAEIDAQVDVATQKANEASEWGQAAGDFATAAGSAATTATNQANAAANSATAAANAQTAAEAARDEAIQILAQKMDFFSVNTYAALQAFISDPEVGPCAIMVFFDETYGGLPRLHIYTGDVPVLGPKLIQFVTYTE